MFLATSDSILVDPEIAVDATADPPRQVQRTFAQFAEQEELDVAFLHLPEAKKGITQLELQT